MQPRISKKFPQSQNPLDLTIEFYNDLGEPLDYKRLMAVVDAMLERASLKRDLYDIKEYPTRDRGQITYRFDTTEDVDTAIGLLGRMFMEMPDEVGYRIFTDQRMRNARSIIAAPQDAYDRLQDAFLLVERSPGEKGNRAVKTGLLLLQDAIGKAALKKPKDERLQQSKKLIDQLINVAFPDAHTAEPKMKMGDIKQQAFRIWSWFRGTRVMDMGKDWAREDEAPAPLTATASSTPRRIKYRGATYVRV